MQGRADQVRGPGHLRRQGRCAAAVRIQCSHELMEHGTIQETDDQVGEGVPVHGKGDQAAGQRLAR